MIEMDQHGVPITEDDIAAFEADLEVRLPDDYRSFLQQTNGGRPSRNNAAFPFRTGGSVVYEFYRIGGELPGVDMATCARKAWSDRLYVPETLLPIGHDAFGDLICLGISGDELNKVYFRDSQSVPDGPPAKPWAKMKGYFKVADSFTEFLSLLGPPDESAT